MKRVLIVLLVLLVATTLVFAGGKQEKEEPAEEEVQKEKAEEESMPDIPEGVAVAGSEEVMPSDSEIRNAIPPSLKELGKRKTIRIMFQGGGDSAPPLETKDLIEEETGLTLKIDVIPPENLHERQLTFFMSGKSDYDLLEIYPTWVGEYAEGNFIQNLDPLYQKYGKEINTDDFIEGAQVGFDKYQGSWYAVPYDGDVNMFYYRGDLFNDPQNKEDFEAEYGYELQPPETWHQVKDMAEFFTGRQEGLYGFGTLALKTWWAVAYWANVYRNLANAHGVMGDNGLVNDAGEIEMKRKEFIEANDLYMELMNNYAPEGILSWGYPESKEGMANGTVAMTMQWATSVFRDPRQAEYWDEIRGTVMPGFEKPDGTVDHVTSFAVGKAMSIPTGIKNTDTAFLYAHFLASKTMQVYETNSGSGVDPNRYSVWEDQRVQDVWGPLVEPTMQSLEIGVGDIKVPQASKLYESLLIELHESWAGNQSSAEAYDNTIEKWEKILSE
jgi:multiple sugar transport system substrate-binding protein